MNAYWKSWLSGDLRTDGALTLAINTHPRQIWYLGSVENLVIHEYGGHVLHFWQWREAIRTGKLSPFLGLLTLHWPDQFVIEGIAESLVHLLPEALERSLSPHARFWRALQSYNLKAYNNVHVIANRIGPVAARSYAMRWLPFASEREIERQIRDRTSGQALRAYLYVYGPAKEAVVGGLKRKGSSARLRAMATLYERPILPMLVRESVASKRERERLRERGARQAKHSFEW